MNDELLIEIKKMNKLLALNLTKDQPQNDKILTLSNAGFKPKEIADLIGTTSNTVRVALSRMKKGEK